MQPVQVIPLMPKLAARTLRAKNPGNEQAITAVRVELISLKVPVTSGSALERYKIDGMRSSVVLAPVAAAMAWAKSVSLWTVTTVPADGGDGTEVGLNSLGARGEGDGGGAGGFTAFKGVAKLKLQAVMLSTTNRTNLLAPQRVAMVLQSSTLRTRPTDRCWRELGPGLD